MSDTMFKNDEQQKAYEKIFDEVPTYKTTSRLVTFLYVLMRDHVTPGVVAAAAIDAFTGETPIELSNGYLAQYAEHLAFKLQEKVVIEGEEDEEGPDSSDQDVAPFLNPDSFRTRQKDRKSSP